MKFQEEIIKAQQEQILHQNLMMSNSDESIMLKSFQECLFGSPNKYEFEKSWSSDLQAKFPEGSFKTINGAAVFVNNGKVIAGLGGFNGAIDEYFSKKEGSKGESEGKTDNEEGSSFLKEKRNIWIPKMTKGRLNKLMEKEKLTTNDIEDLKDFKYFLLTDKQSGVDKGFYEELAVSQQGKAYALKDKFLLTNIENKINESENRIPKTQDKPKESKEEEKDEPMTDSERSLIEHYNKDKKGFIKNNLETAIRRPDEALKSLDKYIEESKNSEHRTMLKEVKQALVDKLAEPEKQKDELKTKMESISHLLNEDKDKLEYSKLLKGDVAENFKKMREYDKFYDKVFKENPKNAVELGNLAGDSREYDKEIRGKTATVKKKEIKVRETDTESALKSITTIDPLRPIYAGIFHDPEGYKVATNLHSLIAVKTDIGDSAGKTINPKTKEDIEGKFPAWKSVIPQKTNGEIKMKLSDLHSLTSQAMEINKVDPISVTKIKGVDQDFNPKIINGAVESMRKLGVEDVSILNGEDGGSRPLIIKGNNKKGEEVTCLIMPMKAVENEHLMITQ